MKKIKVLMAIILGVVLISSISLAGVTRVHSTGDEYEDWMKFKISSIVYYDDTEISNDRVFVDKISQWIKVDDDAPAGIAGQIIDLYDGDGDRLEYYFRIADGDYSHPEIHPGESGNWIVKPKTWAKTKGEAVIINSTASNVALDAPHAGHVIFIWPDGSAESEFHH